MANTRALSSAFLFLNRELYGHGRRALGEAASGRPAEISTDGTSLFVATGNTFGARTWSDGEAVIRLAPDLHRSDDKRDFFAPSDWEALDARDATWVVAIRFLWRVRAAAHPLILALGKDRKAYLLDRDNSAGSVANSPWRPYPSGPSSPPQQPILRRTGFSSHFKAKAYTVQLKRAAL